LAEIERVVGTATPVQKYCENLSPEDALNSTCSCYIQALSAVRLKLVQWGEYFGRKSERTNYLADLDNWEKEQSDEGQRLAKIRSSGTCGFIGVGTLCMDKRPVKYWEEHDRVWDCPVGAREVCRYTNKGIAAKVKEWENENRPPRMVDPVEVPRDLANSNFQCCINLIWI